MGCSVAQPEREMLKIEKETHGGVTILRLSGRIQSDRIACIRQALDGKGAGKIMLDLSDVTIVDIEGVRFLLGCEDVGIDVCKEKQCDAYPCYEGSVANCGPSSYLIAFGWKYCHRFRENGMLQPGGGVETLHSGDRLWGNYRVWSVF